MAQKNIVGRWERDFLQVLILGGGDGALLCELLKHQPAKVRVVSQDALEVMLETESLSCRFETLLVSHQ